MSVQFFMIVLSASHECRVTQEAAAAATAAVTDSLKNT